MPHLTFAELIKRKVPISPSEAAALTLAVARELAEAHAVGRRPALPEDRWIILSSTGQVSLLNAEDGVAEEGTAALANLLRRLLHLDERDQFAVDAIPGGLLVVIARCLRQIDLPPPSPEEFGIALGRFTTLDSTLLAAVFWRAARHVPEDPRSRSALVPGPARPMPRRDRRQRGPSRADLRRAVRGLEREVFELRHNATRAASAPVPARRGRAAMVSAVAAGCAGLLLFAALTATGSSIRDGAMASDTRLLDGKTDAASDGVEAVHTVIRDGQPPRPQPASSSAGPSSGTPTSRTQPRDREEIAEPAAKPEPSIVPGRSATGTQGVRSTSSRGDARGRNRTRAAAKRPTPVSFPGGARPFPFALPTS